MHNLKKVISINLVSPLCFSILWRALSFGMFPHAMIVLIHAGLKLTSLPPGLAIMFIIIFIKWKFSVHLLARLLCWSSVSLILCITTSFIIWLELDSDNLATGLAHLSFFLGILRRGDHHQQCHCYADIFHSVHVMSKQEMLQLEARCTWEIECVCLWDWNHALERSFTLVPNLLRLLLQLHFSKQLIEKLNKVKDFID